MSRLGSYKNTAFNESQKFLVLDPSTSSASLVLASELVAYITPKIGSVLAETTRLSAENTDYKVGELIQTSGATTIGDSLASLYLVVAGGSGDFPMINGNDLLLIVGDDGLRALLISTAAGNGASRVSMEGGPTVEVAVTAAETAILNRVIGVTSRTAMKAYDVVAGTQISLEAGGRSGSFVFLGTDQSAKVTGDPLEGIYVAPDSDPTGASGAFMRQFDGISTSGAVNVTWFGTVGDGVADDTPPINGALSFAHERKSSVYAPTGSYRTTTLIEIEDNGVTKIFGDGKEKTLIRPDIASGRAIHTKTYYSRALIIEDLSINSLNSTDSSGLYVNQTTGWGSAVTLKNVNIVNFTDTAVELEENFNTRFVDCEIRNPSGGSRFGKLLKITGGATFSNSLQFDNCVFHWARIGIQNLGASALSFTSCTFENLDLFHHIQQLPGLSMFEEFDSCWFEQLSAGMINSEINEATLAPITPVASKAQLTRIGFSKNTKSAGVAAPFLNATVEPFYVNQFALNDGIDFKGSNEVKSLVSIESNGLSPTDPTVRVISDFIAISDIDIATFPAKRDGQFLISVKATGLNGAKMYATIIAPMNSVPLQVIGTINDPSTIGDSYKIRASWPDATQILVQAQAQGLTDVESNVTLIPFTGV
jgi:hypothetical protein